MHLLAHTRSAKRMFFILLVFWLPILSTALVFGSPFLAKSNKQTNNNPLWTGHGPNFSSTTPPPSATFTYLEINGWLLTCGGVTVLIDPILEGRLDFGIPALYSASKRVLPTNGGLVDTLPPIDALLITQGLDDHAHARTLRKLASIDPLIPVFAPPSAQSVLERCGFTQPKYLSSNNRRIEMPYFGMESLPTIRMPPARGTDQITIHPRTNGASFSSETTITSSLGLSVKATSGALVGPPWQLRENGYVIRPLDEGTGPSIYIEPHVEFDASELSRLGPVDAVITPLSGMGLPNFELVHGPEATVDLVKTLKPQFILPMSNGEIDASGLASKYVTNIGNPADFKARLKRERIETKILNVKPGEPLSLNM